jgi:hypothetical protein
VIGSASVAVAVAVALGILAWQQRERAGMEANKAESRSLAAASIDAVRTDPWKALDLAIQADEASATPEATDALRRALEAPRERAVLELRNERIWSANFTADSRHVLTQSRTLDTLVWNVRRWNLATGEPELARTHRSPPAEPSPADVSPDGTLRISARQAGVRLSDAATGTPLIELDRLGPGLEGGYRAAEFSPDGRSFLTAGYDRTARVWPLTLRRLPTKGVVASAISPDGQRCLTVNSDATVTWWACANGEGLRSWTLPKPEAGDALISGQAVASFGPNGPRLVVFDGSTTTVWNAENGVELLRLRGPPDLSSPPSVSPSASLALRAALRSGGRDRPDAWRKPRQHPSCRPSKLHGDRAGRVL